jgi:hypothetical protein
MHLGYFHDLKLKMSNYMGLFNESFLFDRTVKNES